MLSIRKKAGSPFWYARGTVEARQADGTIGHVRIEESTRSKSKARAREIADDIERHYHDLAYGKITQRGPTFAAAALTYIQTRGRSDRFVTALIRFFGETPIGEIDQGAVSRAAHALYPKGSPSTHLRAVFAPVTTILRMSGVRPDFKRPRPAKPVVAIPPDEWFAKLLPVCGPRLGALLITLSATGRRLGDLIQLLPEDMDEHGNVTIKRTKTGESVVIAVPTVARDLLRRAHGCVNIGGSKRLFGYSTRQNVYRALIRAELAAGVQHFGTHAAGRHSFATRHLKQGKSLAFVAKAGGWKSARLVIERYGHLEQSEVRDEAERVGEEWSDRLKRPD